MSMNARKLSTLVRGMCIAAALLVGATALRLLTPGYLSPDLAHRLLLAMLGLSVLPFANVIPKMLPPLVRLRGSPAQDQAMRRFVGWSLVLGGIGYALAALFAPLDMATGLACALLGISLLLAVLRFVWAVAGPARE
jgi:hypothetical protein